MQLKDRVVLVTGATGSLGSAVARRAAQEGARLALHAGRRLERAAELRAELGGDPLVLQGDVTDRETCRNLVKETVARFGKLDGLVTAAGVTRDQLALFIEDEDWQAVIDTNLRGTFNCCRYAARAMLANREGRIVTVASVSGLVGVAGQASYAAAKAGVIGLTRSLAREWGRHGIRVNAVAPGLIESDVVARMPADKRDALLRGVVLGRLGTPEEVARVAVFLLGEGSDYVTGQTVVVDGGIVMG
jgi:3-oxoacyl-[acyl-carrier protein] reductase